MTLYRRVANEVQAWNYTGQSRDEWPDFVRDYKVQTLFGPAQINTTPTGTLLIPLVNEPSSTPVYHGDWLVLEHGKLTSMKADAFRRDFETLEVEE